MKQNFRSKLLPQNVLSELHSGRPGEFQTKLAEAKELCAELRLRRLSSKGFVVEPSQRATLKAKLVRSMPSILCPTIWYPTLSPTLSSLRAAIQKSTQQDLASSPMQNSTSDLQNLPFDPAVGAQDKE